MLDFFNDNPLGNRSDIKTKQPRAFDNTVAGSSDAGSDDAGSRYAESNGDNTNKDNAPRSDKTEIIMSTPTIAQNTTHSAASASTIIDDPGPSNVRSRV
eukprot:5008823-Pleurochrysis_carterae.AAC.1